MPFVVLRVSPRLVSGTLGLLLAVLPVIPPPTSLLLALAGVLVLPAPAVAQGNPAAQAPTRLTAAADSCGVNLAWDAPSQNAATVTGYRVLRAQGTGDLNTLAADTGTSATMYSDPTVDRGETYSYRVQALRSGTASAQSNLVEVSVPAVPTPVAVAVTAVPIMVPSTPADYFVLYVTHEVDGTEVEYPVLVQEGEAGTTTLAENVQALPKERYRVEKYQKAAPADVDGDCTDDLTELNALGSMNPVNPATRIDASDGVVAVPNQQTFQSLLARSHRRMILKFSVVGIDTTRPSVYFQNTGKWKHHRDFLSDVVGISLSAPGVIRPLLAYDPDLVASDGSRGVYFIWTGTRRHSFSTIARVYTLLAASMPLLQDNLAYWIRNHALPHNQRYLPSFRTSRIPLVFDKDVIGDTDFQALNPAVGYGRLQVRDPDERPHPRDIVLYEALPNELPRVAGIISAVPQTPLSHVNLRAVQDGIPNAFIRDASADDPSIRRFVGAYVRYGVSEYDWNLRRATLAEVNAHYEDSRPGYIQFPQRDLSVTTITPLSQIGFDDWQAFGVKAANLAVLRTLGFPAGTVPDGFAIPFYFYDTFMTETPLGEETVFGKGKGAEEDKFTLAADTKLIDAVTAMLAHPKFQTDFDIQDEMLDDLRDAIKDAQSPQWIKDALTAMHATYPEEQSLRYRSSTNNEDLPGFNGAGLYDSYTQHPEETEEDGIDKSFKQVLASLWTFRAFTEREFHRIDHLAAAMGILVHPNFSDELANGVAVSFDPTTGSTDEYYVNTQLGEDLVTNPEAHSVPEEVLVSPDEDEYLYENFSNLVEPGELLLSEAQLLQLRDHLTVIHDHFKGLYDPAAADPFAMEIEFKITKDDILAIKQARPWVFDTAATGTPSPRLLLSEEAVTLNEGDTTGAAYGVRLRTRPTQTVTVTISGPASSEVTVDAPLLRFTTATWAIAQTVRLTAALDVDTDNDQLTLTHMATGGEYGGVTVTLPVTVTDDGKIEVNFSARAITLSEGSSETITVRLSEPTPERLTIPIVTTEEQGATEDDYAGVPDERVFEVGEREQSFNFSALQDDDSDSGERVFISFGPLPPPLRPGTPAAATVTLTDTTGSRSPPIITDGGGGSGSGGGGGSRDDHGNTPAQATRVRLGSIAPWMSSTAGEIHPADDVDYFTVTVPHAGVLVVETTGATDTVGTVWQAGEALARADSGGARRNFRLVVSVAAGPVVIVVAGTGRRTGSYTLETVLLVGTLENPGAESFQSGIGVISGWVCAADEIELAIGSLPRQVAAYGTERRDTAGVCGDTDNGFGLLFNWNLLGDGEHTVVAWVDGVELGRATVTVTTLGEEFLRDAVGTCEAEDFPRPGERVTLGWQQNRQNFVIAGGSPPAGATAGRTSGLMGVLENPGPNSFQSGIGVLSGWVCEADTVELEIGTVGRQVAAYGTERLDTAEVCGDVDNGFGLLFNWNLLGDGEHEVVAYVDGEELGRATVRVTTLGVEFLRGVEGECVLDDFPSPGEAVTLEWQQNQQNFVITHIE